MDYVIVECPHCFEPILIYTNEINCKIFLNSAGNYPILIKTSHGNSNKDIFFKYNLQLTSQSNIEGD